MPGGWFKSCDCLDSKPQSLFKLLGIAFAGSLERSNLAFRNRSEPVTVLARKLARSSLDIRLQEEALPDGHAGRQSEWPMTKVAFVGAPVAGSKPEGFTIVKSRGIDRAMEAAEVCIKYASALSLYDRS